MNCAFLPGYWRAKFSKDAAQAFAASRAALAEHQVMECNGVCPVCRKRRLANNSHTNPADSLARISRFDILP